MSNVHFTLREELLPESGSKMDKLVMWLDEQTRYVGYKPTDVITIAYLEYDGLSDRPNKNGQPVHQYNVCNSEYYAAADLLNACKAFNQRSKEDPYRCSILNGQLFDFAIPESQGVLVMENTKGYKPSLFNSQMFELKVTAMLDSVPGAWAYPEDLMRMISGHSYVQSVELTRRFTFEQPDEDENAA